MTDVPNIIADTVSFAGGRMIGRTRLQKSIYLLDQKGLNSGVTFYYHNFGPYSDDIANAVVDGKIVGKLEEMIEFRKIDNLPYSVFVSKSVCPKNVGDLPGDVAKSLIERMTGVTATVLELAATIHWLAFVERVSDWRGELRNRKGNKAEGGRMEKALALLMELALAPTDAQERFSG